ncbi:MAG: WYL domain-containing protein [Synergistaceae bacterium]|nr:WYL domain-containing protein [Synergistaceae bacterium]
MAREISSVRIRRLLRLLAFLRRKGDSGAEIQDIINHCEYTNRRALQDDIRLLRDEYRAEISYKRSTPHRYCLDYEGDFLLSMNLNEKDITALTAGLSMTEHFIPDMKGNCKALWDKIADIIPEKLIDFGKWLAESATVQIPVSTIKPGIFDQIIYSIRAQHVIQIEYISPYGSREAKKHIISPYEIFFKAHSWYMTAGCEGRVLMFKLARIQGVDILPDEEFTNPPENYNHEAFINSAWYVKAGELKYNMKLIITEPMATIISETPRHLTQKITRLDSESVELSADIPDLQEAAAWILSCSPHVKIIEPEELRVLVCDLAMKVITKNVPRENSQDTNNSSKTMSGK